MSIFDQFIGVLKKASIEPKLNFRRDSIALAGKTNFAKITPKKQPSCLLRFSSRLPEDARQRGIEELQKMGIPTHTNRNGGFSLTLNSQTIDRAASIFIELVRGGVKSIAV
jgi:hypothetical protein